MSSEARTLAEGGGCCLTPDDCLAYLEGRCDESAAETLRSHIDRCSACRLVMAEAVRTTSARGGAPRDRTPRTLRDGEVLGDRYEVRRFIARGGMGEVYEVDDAVLRDRVALKTLVPTALDQVGAAERLLAEVRATRAVSHPNVCRTFELGIHRRVGPPAEAIPFLTMPFLQGETVAARLRRVGRLASEAVLAFARDMVAGLTAVHEAGVVHRDFKSENVFLVEDRGGKERAIVMDFGLARGERPGGTARSSREVLLGTIAYMAPEQLAGGPATAASDIFALGLVMFEMLTGRLPFADAAPAGAALSRGGKPVPSVSSLVPGLARSWDVVIAGCLEPRPERRFARAQDVAAALARLIDRPERRRPRRWPAAAGLAIGVGAVVAYASHRPASSLRPASVAEARTLAPPPAPGTPASKPVTAASWLPPEVPEAAPLVVKHRRSEGVVRNARRAGATGRASALGRVADAPPAQDWAPPIEAPADLLHRSEGLLLDGEVAQACALGERAATRSPGAAAVHRFLGMCYMRAGEPHRARASYGRYLELAPDAADAPFVRGILTRRN
jgi:eukaryotic-like serine/threonine-protein kinase